jgi:hypothetical protein
MVIKAKLAGGSMVLAGVYKLFSPQGRTLWAYKGLRRGLAYDLRERFYW